MRQRAGRRNEPLAEHSRGTERTPEDGGSEEGCLSVAVEVLGLVGLADLLEAHLVVEDRSGDEAGDDGAVDLDNEGVSLTDLDVVR
jgi:hypothetical protein